MNVLEGIFFLTGICLVSCDNFKVALFGLAIIATIAIKENLYD